MKLSSYPSWAPMLHLLCWIFQPEKKNILKSPKPLTAFTCCASGPAWPLVPSLLPTKTAPRRFHPASCWQETWRNGWCTQKTTGSLQLAPPHLLNSAFSPQSHRAPLSSEPWWRSAQCQRLPFEANDSIAATFSCILSPQTLPALHFQAQLHLLFIAAQEPMAGWTPGSKGGREDSHLQQWPLARVSPPALVNISCSPSSPFTFW